MKKRIAFLCVFSLACTMLFAACGNNNKENTNQNETQDSNIQVETNLPDDYIIEIEQEDVVTVPEVTLPDPEAELTLTSVSSIDGIELAKSITVNEDGILCLLTSSMDLAGIGIYNTDLTEGINYDASAPLGYCQNIKANEYVSIAVTIPESEFPSILLVAEEHSGALGKYLLCLDGFNSAYLVPVME